MNAMDHGKKIPEASGGFWGRRRLKVMLPLIILIFGAAGAIFLNQSGPQPKKKPPTPIVALVQVAALERSSEQVIIQANGTVIPALEMALKSRVSGEVVHLHPEFAEGGLLKAGDEAVNIDPEDYELAIRQKQSQVANAVYGMKLEQGYQDVAKREWELLGGGEKARASDVELALRKPHLRKARADLLAAEAALAQARLDLARTHIHAPFNAIVRSKNVAVGSQVTTQDTLGELVGTDAYWIQASVPVDLLSWIAVPRQSGDAGSPVSIHYGGGQWTREGQVIKLLSDLETGGRMARILVEVHDPLDLAAGDSATQPPRPPLLIGEYVLMDIEGPEVADVFRIPRSALRDDDRVWIADPNGTLSIRKVSPVWRGLETVFVADGLAEGDRLVLTELPAAVEGMPVRIDASEAREGTQLSGISRND